MKADPVEQATRDVVRLEREVAKRTQERDAAKELETHAADAYDADDSESNLDAISKARSKRERQDRLLASASAELAAARVAERDAKRAVIEGHYARETAALDAWRESIDVAPLVALDRQLDAAVLAVAGKVVDAIALDDAALDHAGALGRRHHGVRPDLASAQLYVQRAIATARHEEARDDFSAWLAGADISWKVVDQTAASLAVNAVTAARAVADAPREAYEAGLRAGAPRNPDEAEPATTGGA